MGEISGDLSGLIPHLRAFANGHQLYVQGKPFLIRGAELQNSTFSCTEYMEQVWPRLKTHHVNTVLANVSWEDIEPREGEFDFALLDRNILAARKHDLHLVLLWFGAFKNGMSSYAPSWVKTSPTRFPRMHLPSKTAQSKTTEVLSIFAAEVVNADAAAFKAMMRHIKEVDSEHSTVLMVQVENEVGLLGASRDISPQAEAIFRSPVPQALVQALSRNYEILHPALQQNLKWFRYFTQSHFEAKSWPEAFGDSPATDELFMAFHYATYVEQVARAGKATFPLPMFTNVWQNYADEDADKSQPVVVGGGGQPGDYPSGGGVINVLDVWLEFAPSLDFIAPDVYLNDYDAVCAKYRHRGQPLFIPEQRRDEYGARRIWSAYGTHHALCASPFGIDTLTETESPWTKHFGLLEQISDHLLTAQASNWHTFGFFFDEVDDDGRTDSKQVCMGRWKLTIERSFVFGKPSPGFGLIIQLAEARFLLAGEGFQVRFASLNEAALFTGILKVVEQVSVPGTKQFKAGRKLNGDETRSGQLVIMPSTAPDLGGFPIAITIPAKTRVAECEVYSF